MKKLLSTVLLCLFSFSLFSQNTVVSIDDIFFNKDDKKKLILINKDVTVLNTEYPDLKNQILSEGIYYNFEVAVNEFEIGNLYTVTNPDNEIYKLYFTELPIINIDTIETIVDEPRVYAEFSLCESDGNFIQNGIGIEYRGGSSQAYSKKSLRIEFWNDQTGDDTENISLLNMRSDDDWNLQAMYIEPLRMRTKICFELWNKIDTLYYLEDEEEAINGVRQEYVELFISDEYRGIYALSERVDKKQLQLKKFKNGEIKGELYKGKNWGATTFYDLPQYDNNSEFWGGFKYIYPGDTINWGNLYNFVDFVINTDSVDFYENYNNKFKIDNAVNYFIFLNLLRAMDNTGKNIFVAKYKKDEPYFYVPWDLDATLGLFWDGSYSNTTNDLLANYFFVRLVKDTIFTNRLKNRWNLLRENVISTNNIVEMFNNHYNYLNSNAVYDRELLAWNEYNFNYNNDIEFLTNWLNARIFYLDNIFNNPSLIVNILETKELEQVSVKIYPNPASDIVNVKVGDNSDKKNANIYILNLRGNVILSDNDTNIDISGLNNGVYLVVIIFDNGYQQVDKLIIEK